MHNQDMYNLFYISVFKILNITFIYNINICTQVVIINHIIIYEDDV